MSEWKVIESTKRRTRWANYESMVEIRVTKLTEKMYSVALLRTKEYGIRNKKPSDVYVDLVPGDVEAAEKVVWLKKNTENLLQGEENVAA